MVSAVHRSKVLGLGFVFTTMLLITSSLSYLHWNNLPYPIEMLLLPLVGGIIFVALFIIPRTTDKIAAYVIMHTRYGYQSNHTHADNLHASRLNENFDQNLKFLLAIVSLE